MKSLLLALLLVAAATLLPAAGEPSLTGKWQVHTSVEGNDYDSTCTFTQKEHDLSGSCVSNSGTVTVSGKVEEKNVTWTYQSEYNGTPLTVTHTGTVESPEKISGTVSVPEFGVGGSFTASLSK